MSRFLVTTALEETWPAEDVPTLFLGEWCRHYDRKRSWAKRDAVVAPYHWDNRQKLHKDYLYLRALHEELLRELAIKLNEIHGVDHSDRYWRIIAGPWLGYFVQMLFDRWAMLRQVEQQSDISGVRVIHGCDEHFVPNDMDNFNRLLVTDGWNERIYGQLLELMTLPVEKVGASRDTPTVMSGASVPRLSRKAKWALAKVAERSSALLCFNTEYFFLASYLPIMQDFILQLKLGQVPKMWRSVAVPSAPIKREMRQWQVPTADNIDDFPTTVRAMIPRHIPKAYLEGYQDLVALTARLPWPKRPKAIFTSNSHVADDVFKAWAAEKSENGTPLVIGQHGGNFGMALWGFVDDHQIAISDRFFTWGWSDPEQKKVVPVGNLKGFGNSCDWDREGIALLVEMAIPLTSYTMYSVPVAGQWLDYFEEQVRFVAALPDELQNKLLVRLFPSDWGWSQKQRWQERFPNLKLEEGRESMVSLVKNSRLYVSTYNATTYLESMSLNIPTLMFWNPKHWELRDSAIPFFEKLKAAGIFHETPESAARQMAAVWDDVASWWESEKVQTVRREFCERYAHIPVKPAEVLEKLFREIAHKT